MNISLETGLLVSSILIFCSILISKTGYRFGIPTLLMFLLAGMLFGSDGLGIPQHFRGPKHRNDSTLHHSLQWRHGYEMEGYPAGAVSGHRFVDGRRPAYHVHHGSFHLLDFRLAAHRNRFQPARLDASCGHHVVYRLRFRI